MMTLFFVLASGVAASYVAVQSLPGWNGTLPSNWYSGFVDVSPSPTIVYWVGEG